MQAYSKEAPERFITSLANAMNKIAEAQSKHEDKLEEIREEARRKEREENRRAQKDVQDARQHAKQEIAGIKNLVKEIPFLIPTDIKVNGAPLRETIDRNGNSTYAKTVRHTIPCPSYRRTQ